MDWNMDLLNWNLIVAGISSLGTLAAAWAAFASRSTAKKALQLQNRLYLYESLKACAERTNAYTKGKMGMEWDFHDVANIVRSLNLAMELINQQCCSKNSMDKKGFKQYFVNLLNMQLYEELNTSNAPDAIFQKTNMDSDGVQIWNYWLNVSVFFEFKYVTDEDLAD